MEFQESYLFKFQKKRGSLETDLIKLIAEKTNKPFMAIRQLTLGNGWNESMLKDSVLELEKGGIIAWWVYRKKTLIK